MSDLCKILFLKEIISFIMDCKSEEKSITSTEKSSTEKELGEQALAAKKEFYKQTEQYHHFIMCSQQLYYY